MKDLFRTTTPREWVAKQKAERREWDRMVLEDRLKAAEDIADEFNLKARDKSRGINEQRHFFCWFMREKFPSVKKITCERIGEMIGRDHSTISTATKKAIELFEIEDEIFTGLTKEIDLRLNEI